VEVFEGTLIGQESRSFLQAEIQVVEPIAYLGIKPALTKEKKKLREFYKACCCLGAEKKIFFLFSLWFSNVGVILFTMEIWRFSQVVSFRLRALVSLGRENCEILLRLR